MNDWVLWLDNVQSHRAVIGIDDRLDAVANVVRAACKRLGVGVFIAPGIDILYPDQLAFLSNHQIGITVKQEEWSHLIHPLLDVMVVHDLAVGVDLIAYENVEIAELPGIGCLAEE